MDLRIQEFDSSLEKEWDDFVVSAYNGCFMQTRKFLNYHEEGRFEDRSLMFYKGGALVAVLPACVVDGTFYAHRGSTFGGFVFSKKFFKVGMIDAVIKAFDEYAGDFGEIILKQLPSLFSQGSVDNLEYLLGANDYDKYEELSFVINLKGGGDLLESFRPNTRSKVRQGAKEGLTCKFVDSEQEIAKFHDILISNLEKHDAQAIHSKDELVDLAKRFDGIRFVHCMHGDDVVAASMIWDFGKVLHTQNISIDYRFAELRSANFMVHFMIEEAVKDGFEYFSFGISTEDKGEKLNFDLAEFKEGFGAEGYLNRIFYKKK
ncbi:GNAT family N-acetyltransferase [Candidatus Gracilibacteria bacterium]|nr:GNAT family N-acetyltransferase [Candidatus Gracilibacteria bacterium]